MAGGRRILDHVNFEARPGIITAVIGPNGAGKSTLLRVLSGEMRATQGVVTLNGLDVARQSAATLARRRVVVPQAAALAFTFTALEVALLGVTVPGFELDETALIDRGRQALIRLGLGAFVDQPYELLSGGERQRVHIARALLQLEISPDEPNMPKALLMDEPTASQDLGHLQIVVNEARRLAGDGLAVMMVLHDLNLAAIVADCVSLLKDGRVIASGAPRQVLTEPLLTQAFDCEVEVLSDRRLNTPIVMPINRRNAVPATGAAE
ncbi:MAG TPA: ATP-binding cassette domain-containing protein [Hyphomicrobium sp.]|nr:ATP-binding cassette domain-containing protein [Hyphomicrobium sp.]